MFHLLRCDSCGKEREVLFSELGELHVKYLKGLNGPYCIATARTDERLKQQYEGEPINKGDYFAAIEKLLDECPCSGNYQFDAPVRCPECGSTDFTEDPEGSLICYD